MTLILKLDLEMVKMYLHTKNEVSMSSSSKVIAWPDKQRQTHRHTDMTENVTYPHTRVVKMCENIRRHLSWLSLGIYFLSWIKCKQSNPSELRALSSTVVTRYHLRVPSGGSKGGARETCPLGSRFLSISWFFGKFWQNRLLAPTTPPWRVGPQPRENPGSAIGSPS